MPDPFWGKYRGTVIDSADPKKLGRLKVSVPAVMTAGRAAWAMPCVPYTGRPPAKRDIPPARTQIWVEFENGDLDYPIWVGCFWTAP